MKAIFAALCTTLLVFAASAFIAGTFDFLSFEPISRFCMIAMAVPFSMIAFAMVKASEEL